MKCMAEVVLRCGPAVSDDEASTCVLVQSLSCFAKALPPSTGRPQWFRVVCMQQHTAINSALEQQQAAAPFLRRPLSRSGDQITPGALRSASFRAGAPQTALRQVHPDSARQSVKDGRHAASRLTCRLIMPKPAWEMAKNRARSHQVGRQKHSAKYLHQAGRLQQLIPEECMSLTYH